MTEDMAVKLEAIEAKCKSNTYRIDELKERHDNLDKIVTSVELLANEQKHVKRDVAEIKDNVKVLTDKPAKRWYYPLSFLRLRGCFLHDLKSYWT